LADIHASALIGQDKCVWRDFLLAPGSQPTFMQVADASKDHRDTAARRKSTTILQCKERYLRYILSSEMDQAKTGLNRKVFIEERGAEIFSEFRPPLIL
jgi:hypothetical protein